MFHEGNETFMLTIDSTSLPPTGVTVGDPGQATVTIVDDDGKQFHYHFKGMGGITKLLTWYGHELFESLWYCHLHIYFIHVVTATYVLCIQTLGTFSYYSSCRI